MISSYGRVYSVLSNKFIVPFLSCWGYYRITASSKINYKQRVKFSIHRVMMIEFCPVPNYQNLQVNHVDGNKTNNVLWNLEWTTSAENSLYCYREHLRFAPNQNQDNISYSEKRTYIDNNEIDDFNKELIKIQLNHGQSLLSIHRNTGYSMNAINKVKMEMEGIEPNKYIQMNRYGEVRLTFTDDQIHAICKYFQDHKDVKYCNTSELYRNCLYELFGIDYNTSLYNVMKRYYKRQYRKDITDLYDY